MHSTFDFKTIIGTKESVYRDSPSGKLEEISSVRTMLPLQKGFNSNSKARLPITIDYLPTVLAFEQGIITRMPFANSTAVATPFRSMVGINNIQINSIIKASTFKHLLESIERNTHDFSVKSLSFRRKTFKVFNSNIGIKSLSNLNDFICDLSKSSFNKVGFFVSQYFKFFNIVNRLKKRSSLHNFLSSYPNIFSKIGLLQNFFFRGNNRNSKAFAVDINSKHIFSLRQFGFLFGKICNDFKVWGKSISFALPTYFKQGVKSLKTSILFNWNRKAFSWIHSKLNKISGFGFKGFAVARNIKFNSNPFDCYPLASDNIPFNIADNLRTKRGAFLAG